MAAIVVVNLPIVSTPGTRRAIQSRCDRQDDGERFDYARVFSRDSSRHRCRCGAHVMSSLFVRTTIDELRKVKRLAEKSIEQLDDAALWVKLDPQANSVANLMRHMAGNMRSRWTDFRTTDGEKPNRQRDREFEDVTCTRAQLLKEWDDGWQIFFEALQSVTDADLQDTIYIREEPHSVQLAILRQVVHYAGHAYQILLLAKHFKGPEWQTLSIPRGQSEEFNQRMLARRRAGSGA
jgi:hypothetical protein